MAQLLQLGRWSAGLGAASVLYYYATDTRCSVHRWITMPVVRRVLGDAEDSHRWAVQFLQRGWFLPRDRVPDDPRLHTKFLGRTLVNPVGLAAGFDKHAQCVDGLMAMGFGMVEIGSITPRPQPGNPRPRMFRLESNQAVINRYGFNSEGMAVVHGRLLRRLNVQQSLRAEAKHSLDARPSQFLGVNLGKNKTSPAESNQDYVDGIRELGPLADYLVVNISSPNTPGLRQLQKKALLEQLLRDVKQARDALPVSERPRPPLLVKIAPDLEPQELQDIADMIVRHRVDGVIISNTTVQRPGHLVTTEEDSSVVKEAGGLSGPPLKPLSLRMVAQFYQLTEGRVPIVGCGGISSGEDALEFIQAGASVVQVYTGFAYQGPALVRDIKDTLTQYCEEHQLDNISQLVGSRSEQYSK